MLASRSSNSTRFFIVVGPCSFEMQLMSLSCFPFFPGAQKVSRQRGEMRSASTGTPMGGVLSYATVCFLPPPAGTCGLSKSSSRELPCRKGDLRVLPSSPRRVTIGAASGDKDLEVKRLAPSTSHRQRLLLNGSHVSARRRRRRPPRFDRALHQGK